MIVVLFTPLSIGESCLFSHKLWDLKRRQHPLTSSALLTWLAIFVGFRVRGMQLDACSSPRTQLTFRPFVYLCFSNY